jgi:pyrimidine deaminase RibD-like protein
MSSIISSASSVSSSTSSTSSTSSIYSIDSCVNNIMDCNISRRHLKCINVAIDEAFKSNILHKHGCVIASNGRILAKGYNTNRTSSKDGLISRCCSCHAEIAAIRNLAKSEGLRGNYKQWVQHRTRKEANAKSNNLYRACIK